MPEHFGHYELEVELGRGGMGVVYRAYDTRRDRTVAIKRLPKHLSDDKTFQERFRRESRMAAKLNEPHIIPIHDFGEIEGQLYLDMRLVEGEDLSNLIVRGPSGIDAKRAVDLISQVASALTAAHTAGLVHRDIKPSNVIVTGMDDKDTEPFAYLVDFGIARSLLGSDGTALTATTGTVGTLAYMAPERISGESGDSRSDVYSLACVLYECVTGKAPFSGEAFQMMFAHVNTEPPAASAGRHDVPAGLDEVIRKGMAKDAGDRYQTAGALASAARQALGVSTGSLPAAPPPPTGSPVFGPPPPYTGPAPSGPITSGPVPSGPVFRPQSGPQSGPQSRPPSGPQSRPPSGPVPEGARATTRFSGPVPPPGAGQFRGPQAPNRPQQNPSGPAGPPGQPRRPPSGPTGPGRPPGAPGQGQGPPGGQPTAQRTAQNPSQRPPGQRPPQGPPPGQGQRPPSQGQRPPGQGQGPPRSFVGGPSGSGGQRPNRTPVIIAAVAVIVLIIAIIVIIVVRNSGDSSAAGRSSGVPSPSDSSPSGPSTSTSASSEPVAGWPAAYQQFTTLIGKKPGDTGSAYMGATCAVASPNPNVGMVDQVACTDLANSPVVFYVGHFRTATDVTNFLAADKKAKYAADFWTIDGQKRGEIVQSPKTVKFADVTTSICALPTYLVQFYADDASNLTVTEVYTNYWKPSSYPDTEPAVCT